MVMSASATFLENIQTRLYTSDAHAAIHMYQMRCEASQQVCHVARLKDGKMMNTCRRSASSILKEPIWPLVISRQILSLLVVKVGTMSITGELLHPVITTWISLLKCTKIG